MRNKTNIKSSFKIGTIVLLTGIIGLLFHNSSVAETRPVGMSFQVFYDELQPYGDWIADPMHGYVWVPYAEPGFQPYATNGYWVMSTYGNTWVSNYDWGWAPFHYGRWYFDDYLGWAWVPGYEWGPAWVNWRTGGGYYGWAPLMPGLNVQVNFNIPSNYWVFVPQRRLISRNIYNYYIPRRNIYRVYNQTTIINNTYNYNNNTYVSGPARREVERATRRSVPVYQVNNSDTPGRAAVSRNSLNVYRPEVRRIATNSRSSQSKPANVVTANEYKVRTANRSSENANRINARTAPTNSRSANTNRSVEARPEQSRRVNANVENNSGINRSVRKQAPETSQRTAPPNRERNAVRPTNQQRNTNGNQNTRVESSGSQPQSTVRQRGQSSSQIRSAGQSAPGSRTVQSSRPSNQVRSQEVQRSRSARNVSSRSSSERSTDNATRSSSTRARSSRGNN